MLYTYLCFFNFVGLQLLIYFYYSMYLKGGERAQQFWQISQQNLSKFTLQKYHLLFVFKSLCSFLKRFIEFLLCRERGFLQPRGEGGTNLNLCPNRSCIKSQKSNFRALLVSIVNILVGNTFIMLKMT